MIIVKKTIFITWAFCTMDKATSNKIILKHVHKSVEWLLKLWVIYVNATHEKNTLHKQNISNIERCIQEGDIECDTSKTHIYSNDKIIYSQINDFWNITDKKAITRAFKAKYVIASCEQRRKTSNMGTTKYFFKNLPQQIAKIARQTSCTFAIATIF